LSFLWGLLFPHNFNAYCHTSKYLRTYQNDQVKKYPEAEKKNHISVMPTSEIIKIPG
jgi:hypothetical protein